MSDRQFNPLGTVNAPADWTLPPRLQILLKQVRASFDGTAAGGSFQPLLRIITDSGHIEGEYPCGTTIAAGASADCTWFPGVAPVAAAATTTTNPWAYISGTGSTSCPGSGTITSLPATAGHFYTNSSATFTTGVSGGITGIVVSKQGHYLVSYTATPFGTPAAGSQYEIQNTLGGTIAGYFGGVPVAHLPTSPIADEGVVNEVSIMTVTAAQVPTAALITQIVNHGTGSVSMLNTGYIIQQLDTDATVLS